MTLRKGGAILKPEKFEYYPMRKPTRIQPECPVYVHGYGLAVQKGSGAAFVQIRLVNRCESTVHSVFLHISGKDIMGNVLYELRFVPLIECAGQPHKDFGEEQLLFLPQGNVCTLDIEIEDILFADGMIWRRQSGQRLLTAEEAGWVTCSCGMKNPGEAHVCAYCRKPTRLAGSGTAQEFDHFLFGEMKTLTEASIPEPPAVIWETPGSRELAPVAEIPQIPVPEIADYQEMQEDDFHVEESTEAVSTDAEETLKELEQLLYPFGAWIACADSKEEEPSAQAEEPVEVHKMEDAEEPSTPEESATESPKDEEVHGEPVLPMDLMQETGLLLEELQRRIRAREAGESPVNEDDGKDATEEPDTNTDGEGRTRGIGFWVFMILLMILLALAGFFGVLYWKGYFG